jgi:hypothetical protein
MKTIGEFSGLPIEGKEERGKGRERLSGLGLMIVRGRSVDCRTPFRVTSKISSQSHRLPGLALVQEEDAKEELSKICARERRMLCSWELWNDGEVLE